MSNDGIVANGSDNSISYAVGAIVTTLSVSDHESTSDFSLSSSEHQRDRIQWTSASAVGPVDALEEVKAYLLSRESSHSHGRPVRSGRVIYPRDNRGGFAVPRFPSAGPTTKRSVSSSWPGRVSVAARCSTMTTDQVPLFQNLEDDLCGVGGGSLHCHGWHPVQGMGHFHDQELRMGPCHYFPHCPLADLGVLPDLDHMEWSL